jgi:hypothetical protein
MTDEESQASVHTQGQGSPVFKGVEVIQPLIEKEASEASPRRPPGADPQAAKVLKTIFSRHGL